MIANVAPTQAGYFGTYHTLNFASKSKNIVNAPLVNEEEIAEPEPEPVQPPPERRKFKRFQVSDPLSLAKQGRNLGGNSSAANAPASSSGPEKRGAKRRSGGEVSSAQPNNNNNSSDERKQPDRKRRRSDEELVREKDQQITRLVQENAQLRRERAALVVEKKRAVLPQQQQTRPDKDRMQAMREAVARGTATESSKLQQERERTAARSEIVALTKTAREHEANGRLVASLRGYRQALRLDPGHSGLKTRVLQLERLVRAQRVEGGVQSRTQAMQSDEGERSSDSEFVPSSDEDDTESFTPVKKRVAAKTRRSPARAPLRPVSAVEVAGNSVANAGNVANAANVPVADVEQPTKEQPQVLDAMAARTALLHVLNEGSLTDVMALKGIGAKKAQAILEFRTERHFGVLDDLRSTRMKGGFGKKGLDTFLGNNSNGMLP
jgi:DNA uptake protein ComE-like DNA-binding protein